jgi:glycerol uptake facilitator-like aquaporin
MQVFVAILIGLSGSLTHLTAKDDYGNFLTSDWAWGLAVMLGIYLAGGVSGAHLNPGISIMLSLYRGFPWRQCAKYIVAQFLGAFAAAAVAYGLYHDAIMHYSGALGPQETGLGFYTQPQAFISPTTAFFKEFVATGVLSCSILALGDDSNAPPGAGMAAFVIGLAGHSSHYGIRIQTLGLVRIQHETLARDLSRSLQAMADRYSRPQIAGGFGVRGGGHDHGSDCGRSRVRCLHLRRRRESHQLPTKEEENIMGDEEG